jgi:KUP system potassium uptake protein
MLEKLIWILSFQSSPLRIDCGHGGEGISEQDIDALDVMIMEMVAMISVAIIVILFSVQRCFTRVTVTHTSSKHEGQVYIPEINYILMLACIIVTASFKDTTKIDNAYGMAVVGVMIVTSSFLTLVMLMIWQTHLLLVIIFVTVFGAIEFTYFSAVLYKFPQGDTFH